jgi:phosphatidylinositol dimannoside acyltransferase
MRWFRLAPVERPEQVVSVSSALRHDGAFFRRLAYLGAHHGPEFWLRYSPAVFGLAFACALPEQRRRVRDTLRWVRGPVEPWRERREVVDTFVSYAHCLAESLAQGRRGLAEKRVRREGEAHFTGALARGRGVVIVTAHVGPWDAAAQLLRDAANVEVVLAMAKETDAQARGFHDAVRERSGLRVTHVGEHPLDALPLLRHLQKGGVIAAQLDRGAPSGRLLAVRAFGSSFPVPEGPFRLAALAGAPVVPLFARRLGHFDYQISMSPAIELGARADTERLTAAAQQAVDRMAAFIREDPTQWFRF